MTVIGADKVRRRLSKLKQNVREEMAKANKRSGEELIRIARILHPGDGSTKAEIKGTQNPDGSYLADFGSKAKVTEGDKGPRPFVNPALSVTRKSNRGRQRRAVNKAVKDSFNG